MNARSKTERLTSNPCKIAPPKPLECGGLAAAFYGVSRPDHGNKKMPTLARKLRLTDYFTLAFGTMVGVGWLVLMDDWLARGGPLGAALGFALGRLLLLPVCYLYSQFGPLLPHSAPDTPPSFGRSYAPLQSAPSCTLCKSCSAFTLASSPPPIARKRPIRKCRAASPCAPSPGPCWPAPVSTLSLSWLSVTLPLGRF